jgi:hypothetical protein
VDITAAMADVELFAKAGFEENTSRKNAAAVVNENHAKYQQRTSYDPT